jgi:hypothetical protein
MLYINLYRRMGLGKGFTIRAADLAPGIPCPRDIPGCLNSCA